MDFPDLVGIESLPEISISDGHATGEIVLPPPFGQFHSALDTQRFYGALDSCQSHPQCQRLQAHQLTIPGSPIGFATVSNFLMLLLVQAPNIAHATRGEQLVDSWLQGLRYQSKSFSLVKLGLARLDAFIALGCALKRVRSSSTCTRGSQ